LWSDHATDPAAGYTRNAFDLVRVHRFSYLDEKFNEVDTDENKAKRLPSFTAMLKFANRDYKTKLEMCKKNFENHEDIVLTEEIDFLQELYDLKKDWKINLDRDDNGKLENTVNNLLQIFENDIQTGFLAHDGFIGRTVYLLPEYLDWGNAKNGNTEPRPVETKTEISQMLAFLERAYHLRNVRKNYLMDVINSVSSKRPTHRVQNYLEQLPPWDGVARIEYLLRDFLGVAENAYTKVLMKKVLTAAIRRVYSTAKNAVKFDEVLILIGGQGIGKSTFLKNITPNQTWFQESMSFKDILNYKTACEKIPGKLIVEIQEFNGKILRNNEEDFKKFFSTSTDSFRKAYDIDNEDHPRQCVFVGSANSTNGIFTDLTGNRRYWPVECMVKKPTKDTFKDMTDKFIAQVWAEAKQIESTGFTLYLSPKEEELANVERNKYLVTTGNVGQIEDFVDMIKPRNWSSMSIFERRLYIRDNTGVESSTLGGATVDEVCVDEVLCEKLAFDLKDIKCSDRDDVERTLIKLGWTKRGVEKVNFYGRKAVYVRGEF
jgi:predicted P-loop ATPase